MVETESSESLRTREIQRFFDKCPACSGGFAAHNVATFAMTVAREETSQRTNDFLQALQDQRWRDAKSFHEFDGAHNAAVAKVLRCTSGSLVLLIVRDPVELYESSSLLACEVLSSEVADALNSEIASEQWERLC